MTTKAVLAPARTAFSCADGSPGADDGGRFEERPGGPVRRPKGRGGIPIGAERGVVEGCNGTAKQTTRKAFGFWSP
jgi:hypothetical protein